MGSGLWFISDSDLNIGLIRTYTRLQVLSAHFHMLSLKIAITGSQLTDDSERHLLHIARVHCSANIDHTRLLTFSSTCGVELQPTLI